MTRHVRLLRALGPTVVVAHVVVGCAQPTTTSRLVPTYDDRSGRLSRLTYDSDGNGRADMVASMEGRSVRVVEVDEDHDGQPDRWEYFAESSDAGSGPTQRLVRVEHVTRQGTVIVRREGFEGGQLAWAREDRDADGRDDRWETYRGGALSLVELDADRTGRPERRLRYAGDRVTVEIDPTESGSFTAVGPWFNSSAGPDLHRRLGRSGP